MSRKDERQLRAILESMRAKGVKITVDSFIATAEGGDRTFMSAFLARWREEVEERERSKLPELPVAAAAVLSALELQFREVFGHEQARLTEHYRIVDREWRAREAQAAAEAAEEIDGLRAERDRLLEQMNNLRSLLSEQQQCANEGLLEKERLESKLQSAEHAVERERNTFVAIMQRLEADVAETRDHLRVAEEARFRAVHERESLQRELSAKERELSDTRDQLKETSALETAIRTEHDLVLARLSEYEQQLEGVAQQLDDVKQHLEDMTRQRDEERAARADIARQLRLSTERPDSRA
jgi:DNA repair exonuclease SbcCD ATPase subunit